MSPSITEYTGILHRHGVGSNQADEYKRVHAHHDGFIRKAMVMDEVFRVRDKVAATER